MGYGELFIPPQEAVEVQPIDDGYFLDTYGLGPEETSATVTFGSHTGTVAAMLADKRCPVGGVVAEAYKAEGISGVESKLSLLGAMSDDFSLRIGEKTRSYHAGTVNRDELFARPEQKPDRPEHPDFLA